MDDHSRETLVLGKKILAELRSLSATLLGVQKQTESIAKEYNTQNERTETPPVLRAELQIPKGIVSDWERESTQKAHREKFANRVSVLTLFAVIAYAVLVCFQWREMVSATDAAFDAANQARLSVGLANKAIAQAREQFRQDQRPYIWLTNQGLGFPDFIPTPNSPSSGQVIWTWHYTDYGKTPAYNVRFYDYISIGNRAFARSYQAPTGPDIGAPLPPNKDDFATVVSEPGITQQEYARVASIMNTGKTISIRVRIEYTDAYGGDYETGICLNRINTGAIGYCREGNYIK
jgi:hypothetical protein